MTDTNPFPCETDKYNPEIMRAVVKDDLVKVKQLISEGYDVNYQDPSTMFTALFLAYVTNKRELFMVLLEAGANINAVDRDFYTMLDWDSVGDGSDNDTINEDGDVIYDPDGWGVLLKKHGCAFAEFSRVFHKTHPKLHDIMYARYNWRVVDDESERNKEFREFC